MKNLILFFKSWYMIIWECFLHACGSSYFAILIEFHFSGRQQVWNEKISSYTYPLPGAFEARVEVEWQCPGTSSRTCWVPPGPSSSWRRFWITAWVPVQFLQGSRWPYLVRQECGHSAFFQLLQQPQGQCKDILLANTLSNAQGFPIYI